MLGHAFEGAQVPHLQEQVARLAAAERTAARLVVVFHEVLERRLVELEAEMVAHEHEQFSELPFRRIGDFDLVRYAAQEGVVDQISRFQVGGEDDELIEGDLQFAAVGQVEEVVTLFERNDPPVEQLIDAHPLPAEVVDDERAAVGLELQGGFTDPG